MMLRTMLLVILSIFAVSPLWGQKRAFTVPDLYSVKNVSDLHLSRDGRSIIYTVGVQDLARAKRTSHIWIMNPDGSGQRQLLQGDKSEGSPSFSPDGKWISFVSSR